MNYYKACVDGRSNARSDWLTVGFYNPVMPLADYGPGKTKQNPCNWLLINLERAVFTEISQTSTLAYWPRYRLVNTVGSEIFP